MKKIYKLCSFLLVFVMLFVMASCGNSVSGSMSITPKRVSVNVDVTINDSKSVAGKISCTIYELKDSAEELVYSKEVSLNSANQGSVEFTTLNVNTSYKVYLYANYNSKKHVLDVQTTKTTNSGTVDEPILITNYDEFLNISKDNEAYYSLQNDIDCGENEINAFFDSTTTFKGGFDGNGHTISNFVIPSQTKQYSGLFGQNDGTIKNVTFKDITISSSRSSAYIGVVCGKNCGEISNVTIDNAKLDVKATGTGLQYVGALVGVNGDKALVSECKAVNTTITANMKNKSFIGGLIGSNDEPSIKKYVPEVLKSSFSGTMNITFNSTYSVDILSYVGGLVGYNSCLIEDSFSDVLMTINSTKTSSSSNDYKNYVGGLVGYAKVGNISKSAAKADIDYVSADVTDVYIGGIAGYLDNHAFITNSVFAAKNGKISASCRAAEYVTSTSTSDERYVKLVKTVNNGEANKEVESYELMANLYYKDGEEYKALTSGAVKSDLEVYKKENEEYVLVDGKVAASTLYKFVDKSNAYAGGVVGFAKNSSNVVGYQNASFTISIKDGSDYNLSYADVKESFEGFNDSVLAILG